MTGVVVARAATVSRAARMAAPAAAAGLALGACLLAGLADPSRPNHLFPPCPFRALTGWDCPGCGTTRALHALLHGDVAGAVRLNALAVVLLPFLLWRFAVWTRAQWAGRPAPERRYHPAVLWGLVAVVVAWWVVRNLPWAPFRALHV